MIRIQNIKLPVSHTETELRKKLEKVLKISSAELEGFQIRRRSIDARKKPQIWYVYTVDVIVKKDREKKIITRCRSPHVTAAVEKKYCFPEPGEQVLRHRPVIIGSGPGGLFCAWELAKYGYRPLILERGRMIEQRIEDVEKFWRSGKLDPQSNVQFGEGGAGTFSDGKLNTLVKDPGLRSQEVLEIFAEAGAPKEILYDQKPHIGTDVLRTVVKTIRKQILEWGGEFRFESQVTGFLRNEQGINAVVVNETEQIPCEAAILAIGHSARDTFLMLKELGIAMEAKAFAVGLRMEHPQTMINRSQYGAEEAKGLGAASYKTAWKAACGRGVYSFCMCPGGYVVNASSEPGRLAVNGMSNSARDEKNANSALIVTVTPDDFDEDGVLAGISFQRKLEEKAYQLGNGNVPIQKYEDFKENRISKELGEVIPAIKGEWAFANLRNLLPESLNQPLIEGIEAFGEKIHGFNRSDSILSGVESRTSSPVRIIRDQNGESSLKGLYPCGEGAGYAGGITSAAMDGIRIAEKIRAKYKDLALLLEPKGKML